MSSLLQNPFESTTFGNSLLLRVDGAIGAMSLSPNGRDAVLAGRKGLFIIDLEDPFTKPRLLHHLTSWEVADVQWSPHYFSKPSWCISTSNQKALLWDLARPSSSAIFHVLHQHTRAITDINFHPSNPEILSTCSVDTFVMSWDMRCPRKPVTLWAEWRAGATQVKWNHKNPNEIVSAHDHSFYLWDSRKTALPVLKVNRAHNGKINGLDVSDGVSNIITCSNDKTIKFWDLNKFVSQNSESTQDTSDDIDSSNVWPAVVVKTDFPVSRARNLPFGSDKACGVMPLRGGEDAIHILNYEHPYREAHNTGRTQIMTRDDIHFFKGHKGPIKDFLWRARHENYDGFESKTKSKDYQLVTWSSQDCDLKLWSDGEELYRKVNYNPSNENMLDLLPQEFSTIEGKKDEKIVGKPCEDSTTKKMTFKYDTYCTEPPISIDFLSQNNRGDLLSSSIAFKIAQNNKFNSKVSLKFNHLNWISGVRMGRREPTNNNISTSSLLKDDGPFNLGEEASIVGRKFPKIRFEKISVSTGDLVISLTGPLPQLVGVDYHQYPQDLKKRPANERDGSASQNTNLNGKDHNEVVSGERNRIEDSSSKPKSLVNAKNIATNSNSGMINSTLANDPSLDISKDKNTLSNSEENYIIENQSKLNTSTSQYYEEENLSKCVFIRLKIKFPQSYPFLEEAKVRSNSSKKASKLHSTEKVQFDIEETHELSSKVKEEMLKRLDEIAYFYVNKYQKFCLEPCLRYLLGEVVELSDSSMVHAKTSNYETLGTDDTQNASMTDTEDIFNILERDDKCSFADEDYENDSDIIPPDDLENISNAEPASIPYRVNDSQKLPNATLEDESMNTSRQSAIDSTPVPKGCGAVWSQTGKLVCFFIPKSNEESSRLQPLNIFKLTDNDNNSAKGGELPHHYGASQSLSVHSVSENGSATSSISSDESDGLSLTPSSSDEELSDNLSGIFYNEYTSKNYPRLLNNFLKLENVYMLQDRDKITKKGNDSNNQPSIADDAASEFQSKRKNRLKSNIVGIFDFSHLMPDKYELACEYKVLGDSPQNLARYNSEVALKYGLYDISHVWKILELVLTKNLSQDFSFHPYENFNISRTFEYYSNFRIDEPSKKLALFDTRDLYWGLHPFGRTWLIKEIIRYFELKKNIQMLAMLSCILFENPSNIRRASQGAPANAPYKSLPQNFLYSSQGNQDHFGKNHFHKNAKLTSKRFSDPSWGSIFLPSKRDLKLDSSTYERSISSSHGSTKDSLLEKYGSHKNIQFHQNSNISLPIYPLSPGISNLLTPPHQRITRGAGIPHQKKQKQTGALTRPSRPQGSNLKPPPSLSVEIQNADSLDLYEDCYANLLIVSQDADKIKRYREKYAAMLFAWGLPLDRLTILKFNYPAESLNKRSEVMLPHLNEHRWSYGLRRSNDTSLRDGMNHVTATLETSLRNGWNSNKRNFLKYCHLCNTCVTKRVSVCTNCEHILHAYCAVQWWSHYHNMDDYFEQECPSGCGCKCLKYKV